MATSSKTAAKKSAARKTASTGSTPAAKVPTQAAAKKASATQVSATQATAKKSIGKKAIAKKSIGKKAIAKKATAKKATTTKATSKQAPGESTSDAIALLVQDHRDVHRRFEDYQELVEREADGEERQALALEICDMLTAHTTIEEEIFYPATRDALNEDDLLDEAEVEHASAKDLIAQIRGMGPDDDLYDAKVTVLGEYVDHHVGEEEGEMFPKCRKADLDLDEIGARLEARKQELLPQEGA